MSKRDSTVSVCFAIARIFAPWLFNGCRGEVCMPSKFASCAPQFAMHVLRIVHNFKTLIARHVRTLAAPVLMNAEEWPRSIK